MRTDTRRTVGRPAQQTVVVAALVLWLALVAAACSSDDDGDDSSGTTGATTASTVTTAAAGDASPPQIPADFTWSGRYVVQDLGFDVPFTWEGRDGNFQMVAGGDDQPIHFTYLITDGTLYTLTYEWPDIPRQPCSNVGPMTLDELNEGLANAHFVGAETLEGAAFPDVNHFRVGVSMELPPGVVPTIPGVPLRIPIMAGDFYVDRDDPTTLSKVLHFGLQNLYAPELDEWIIIDEASDEPGEVSLPDECADAAPPSAPPTPAATPD